jgi:hypothetical protein
MGRKELPAVQLHIHTLKGHCHERKVHEVSTWRIALGHKYGPLMCFSENPLKDTLL